MRVKLLDVDTILYETGNSVNREDSEQFLQRVRNRVRYVELIGHIGDRKGGEIDKAHPPELKALEESDWFSEKSFD